MVPGSTLMYGSNLISATCSPRLSSKQPIEEAASPFPKLDTTPPVTKIYLGILFSWGRCWYLRATSNGNAVTVVASRSRFRWLARSLFTIITSLFKIFLRLDSLLHGRVEGLLQAHQTSANQTRPFLSS